MIEIPLGSKVISVMNPWAEFIAAKHKGIETRSWKTDYRGPLYIHVSANMPAWVRKLCPEFGKLLGLEPYNGSRLYYMQHGCSGNFGKIIAKCELVACLPIITNDELNETAYADACENWYVIDGNEYHFGDYTPGRFAWILKNVERMQEPIPAKGKLGLWTWKG